MEPATNCDAQVKRLGQRQHGERATRRLVCGSGLQHINDLVDKVLQVTRRCQETLDTKLLCRTGGAVGISIFAVEQSNDPAVMDVLLEQQSCEQQ